MLLLASYFALRVVLLNALFELKGSGMKSKLTFWHYLVMAIIAFGFIDASVMLYLATWH